MREIISLFIEIYYNNYDNNYYHILSLNKTPSGPLREYILSKSFTNPSSKIKKSRENYCILTISKSILDINNYSANDICTIDDLSEIYEFLINNNYTINNDLNNIFLNMSLNINYNNNKKLLTTFNYKIE